MADDTPEQPNVVLVFTDDQGFGDVGCFGSPYIETPNLDRMATEGAKFTSFYTAAPICTPSRAALMTGSYPTRVGLEEGVLFPGDREGLHPDEVTVADLLSDAGYATACIGKWHLGDREPFLPTDHGFDRYLGVPYSNDMGAAHSGGEYRDLPLMQDTETVEAPVDQTTLTRRRPLRRSQTSPSAATTGTSSRRSTGASGRSSTRWKSWGSRRRRWCCSPPTTAPG
jgi:arylsulfatase A